MLTRFALLTAVLFCVSGIARAQTDGAAGGNTSGTTTQGGGATATTGSTTTTNTNASLTNTPVGQGEGAVSSDIQAMTVESTRSSGLQNLGGNTLQATSATPGGNTLPGGSQFGTQNRGNTQNRNTQRGGTSSSRSIRPSLRLGFTPIVRPAADVSRSVGRSFSRIASRRTRIAETKPELRNVRIEPGKAGLLTLTGSVPTAAAKRLAANLLRMEPGVRKVQNNLTVAEAPTAR